MRVYFMLVSFLLPLILMSFSKSTSAQVKILSNRSSWEVSDTRQGPWRTPINLSDAICLNEQAIDCMCGSFYEEPNNVLESCSKAKPIWGEWDNNNDCNWPQDTFYFRTTFDLNSCVSIEDISGSIAIDNEFNVFVNGEDAGGASDWRTDFDLTSHSNPSINVEPYLNHQGQNEIIVEGINLWGGTCFNYVGFLFCLEIETVPTFDTDFTLEFISGPNDQVELDFSSSSNDDRYISDWAVQIREDENVDWHTEYISLEVDSDEMMAPACQQYRVIHRILDKETGCSSCCTRVVEEDCYGINYKYKQSFSERSNPCITLNKNECQKAFNNAEVHNTYLLKQPSDLVNIYPNPASEYFFIDKIGDQRIAKYKILDTKGKIIKSTLEYTGNRIDCSEFQSGIYIVEIYFQNGLKEVKKIEIFK